MVAVAGQRERERERRKKRRKRKNERTNERYPTEVSNVHNLSLRCFGILYAAANARIHTYNKLDLPGLILTDPTRDVCELELEVVIIIIDGEVARLSKLLLYRYTYILPRKGLRGGSQTFALLLLLLPVRRLYLNSLLSIR